VNSHEPSTATGAAFGRLPTPAFFFQAMLRPPPGEVTVRFAVSPEAVSVTPGLLFASMTSVPEGTLAPTVHSRTSDSVYFLNMLVAIAYQPFGR